MTILLPILMLLAGSPAVASPSNPSLTLKKPVTVAASFTTLKLFAFTVDFSSGQARTAFQSWDETAEKHWTGYVVVVDTDAAGSHVTRGDGKKSDCAVTFSSLLEAIPKGKQPSLVNGITTALFAPCVDQEAKP